MSAVTALVKKNVWHLLNAQRIIRAQSRFKVLFILCFAILLEAGLWALFVDGFRFLDGLGGAGALIVGRLFSLFFLGMAGMLVVSGIVTSYSTVFGSDEVPFLVVRPFEMSHIVVYKFIESTGFSSWAFFFIIVPFVGAYAWYEGLSPLFALWTLLFAMPLLVLCSGVGTLITMLFVRWMPRTGFVRWIGVAAATIACIVGLRMCGGMYDPSAGMQFDISRLVPGLRLASNPLLPGWWVSEGITSLARGQWLRGGMLWATVASSALLMFVILEWVGSHIFFEGWQRVIGGRATRRAPVLLAQLDRALSRIDNHTRALVMKDVRTFLRDPVQWSQVLIFFGLLGLYFANLRSFNYHLLHDTWRNTVAFLNVFSVSAVMCSMGSRFVYPQLSLEGHGFWILGLSPLTMTKVLAIKFVVALVGMLTVSVALMLLSASMLNAAPAARTSAVAVACAISFGVCGLSTGLGAMYLDLDRRNPAAIVSGFGGTLNLVFSLAFMLAAILPFGIVFHLHGIQKIDRALLARCLCASGIWLFVITAIVTAVPLWLGNRSLCRREF